MAVACEEFLQETLIQDVILSFPREWQGLFAALNINESLAIQCGTKWLRDSLFFSKKNSISPHWPDLVRALCLLFPVVSNKEVVFLPKFACLPLKLQRNMLCFIVYHTGNVPADDLKVLVTMLLKLPQMKQSWYASLVWALQTKLSNCADLETGLPESTCSELKDKVHTIKICPYGISQSNSSRLVNLCSNIKASSSAPYSLLNSKLEPGTSQAELSAECEKSKLDKREQALIVSMEVDNIVQSEVIEIIDDSPVTSPLGRAREVPNPPVCSILIDEETDVYETKETDPVSLEVTSLPFSEVPHPPAEEIQTMEIEPFEEDAFTEKYIYLKDHLQSSDDVEFFQEFLTLFPENSPKDLMKICKFMEMPTIPENSIVMLISQFLLLEKECSFKNTVLFAEYCIGVWLSGLQQTGSRNFLAGVTAFAKKYPKAFVDGVMVKQFESLQWPQYDLIAKVTKNFEKDTLRYFLEELLQSKETGSFYEWNDHMVILMTSVLDRKLDIDASVFENLHSWLQFQSLPLASNLKFAKLLLTVIDKYSSLVKLYLSSFKQMLEENRTFLKKSGLTTLKKMEV